MGVPKFFRYISERYPCLSELVRDYEIPDFDNLYLDMNGIIHICSHPNDGDAHFRISEEKIIQDIFHYIEVLFRMIKPKKLFFMAVDGVAPRAKMNQQRGRRFRSAKEAEKLETEALARGEQLPTEARFDSNCITPGTVFMARLHEQLKYFVVNKISTDKLWQGCKIILSGHETPGEGEHKIMDYIRYMRSQPNYDPNTRHCLYGLDADLLMLGMCTHEPHFCLLREEVKFGKKSTKRKCVPEEISFYLLHLSLMREYLDLEFASLKDTLPFDYDIEKIIDDWVLMGFLVGNDFIPHLPNMHIANGALPVLYEAYIKILPSLGGYINEGGTLNLKRFEKYLDSLRSIDIENFSEHYADLKYFEGKTGRRPNDKERTSYKPKQLEAFEFEEKVNEVELEPEKTSTDSGLAALIKATDDMFLEPEKSKSTAVEPSDANLSNLEEEFEGDFDYESDQSTDDDLFNEEFRLHKRDYYMNKLEYSQVTPEVLKSQAEGYVRAIQWNLNYYYNGVCSWSWYYPHHYAPYLSDIKGFGDLKLDFELGKPFKPYEQLLAVLPAASKSLLPECYQDLMTSENSPLKHYYPTDFKTDLNGKRQDWEALVLIPFIDEDVLLKAMEPHSKKLSLEEIKRNTHRPMLVYSYTKEDLGNYEAPQYFPPIKNNHAECMALSIDDIRIPVEKLVKGRYPGAKKDVFYPGFPTFRHLNYTGTLEKAKVKVFEQPSRSDNMIINVIPKPLLSEDALARQILGNTVFIGWPHLREALAVSITTSNYKYNYVEGYPGQYNLEDLRDSRTLSFEANGTILHYKNRLGINVGETKAVVHAKPLVGRKCIYTPKGEVSFEKQWDKTPANYPYQTIIYGIKYYEEGFSKFSNIQLLFPVDSECFLLTHPMYGSVGKIMDSKETLPKGRLKLSVKVQEEPNLNSIIEMEHKMSMEYMQLSAAASRLSISRNVFSRITGTIYLLSRNDMPSESTYKMNVGLNLKFNVKNQEIPGYTKRVSNVWLYSQKAIDLVQSYILFCPELFQFLNMSDKNDDIFKEDLFPENCDERVKGLKEWLKQQPYQSIERLTCGSEVMDPESVKKLENLIDAFCENLNSLPKPKNTVMQVKPYLLYKPGLQTGNIMPDPSTNFQLCDRVINVRESYTVPLALKGTIIAIHKSTTGSDSDVVYDVLFDSPFVGGLTLNCSPNRAYRLPPTAMINISYGARMYKKMTGEPGQLLQTLKAANNLNYRNQPQNSAFAAFMDVNRSVPSVSNYSNNYRPHVYQNKSQPALSVFGAYPQQFGGPYQQKPFNKGFNQPVINTNNKGTVNMASNIKAHNNFMPNFVNNGISMSTKQTHLKPENKIPNKGSPKKEPAAPVKVIDTEILKKVLKISDTETDKTPPRVKQEDAKRKVAEIKPSRSTEQKILKKDLVNISINVPAPPTSWVTSTMPQQKVQTQVYHREKIVTRSSVEKVTKSNESLQDSQSKTVFVPLQAERAHLKNQNSTSYNLKKGDPSPKKDQQNQPGSTQKLENAQKDDKKDSSNQNTGVKKQRKVRMAANFSVKMSLP